MYKKELAADCGMWGLWSFDAYGYIDDYDKWDKLFCEDEDIEKQVLTGSFVPFYIHSDGVCSFVVKVDEPLSERESKFVCVKSEKYLFRAKGKTFLSGTENIGEDADDESCLAIDLPEGNYAVTAHLISWDEEPGAYLENGEVSPDALPDFVILIESGASPDGEYRQSVETFEE